MSETTTVSAATAPAAEVIKPKRSRGVLNRKQLNELARVENVALAAQHPDHAPAIDKREITAPFVQGFVADTTAARSKAAEVVQHRTAAQSATATEVSTAKALIGGLQEAQKAAKQKYARTNRIALKDYFVGKPLNGNRANLQQTSQTILNKVNEEDDLPGFNAAKIRALTVQRQNWVNAQQTQAEATMAAQNSLAELKEQLKSLTDRRLAIQLAADAEWPHTDEANAGARREFGLPRNRPVKV